MSTDQERIGEAGEPTEEELRAAYEAQVKRLRVEHVVLETVVTLANLGMRRTGLAPGTEEERDPEQVRMAVDSIRALMPVVETAAPEQVAAIRDALSQLQLAFVRIGGQVSDAPASARAGGGAGSSGGGPRPGSERGPGAGSEGGPGPGSESGPGAGSEGPPGGGEGGPGPGQGGPAPGGADPGAKPEEPGPAQRSGRLWVPGQ